MLYMVLELLGERGVKFVTWLLTKSIISEVAPVLSEDIK